MRVSNRTRSSSSRHMTRRPLAMTSRARNGGAAFRTTRSTRRSAAAPRSSVSLSSNAGWAGPGRGWRHPHRCRAAPCPRDHCTTLVLSTNRGRRWTLVPVERTTPVCDVTWPTVEQGWNSSKAFAGGTERHPSSLLPRPGGFGRSPPSQDLSQDSRTEHTNSNQIRSGVEVTLKAPGSRQGETHGPSNDDAERVRSRLRSCPARLGSGQRAPDTGPPVSTTKPRAPGDDASRYPARVLTAAARSLVLLLTAFRTRTDEDIPKEENP